MKLYSFKNQEPTIIPERIRLSNGFTRTDSSTYTEEEISDSGYVLINQEKPHPNQFEMVEWSGSSWVIRIMTEEEKNSTIEIKFKEVRQIRDNLINSVEWRIQRHESELRLGLTPTDDIKKLDEYIQALRDITKQEDPFNVSWPELDK